MGGQYELKTALHLLKDAGSISPPPESTEPYFYSSHSFFCLRCIHLYASQLPTLIMRCRYLEGRGLATSYRQLLCEKCLLNKQAN